MSSGEFEVDTTLMHSAGDSTEFAGEAASKAASRLAEARPAGTIFGDFDAAHTFLSRLTETRNEHQQRSQAQHAALKDISGKSHLGARVLTTTDTDTAVTIRTVGDQTGALGL